MGKVSRPRLVNLLKKDKERYKQLFEQGNRFTQQPVSPPRKSLRTKDITGKRKPIQRRPRRPQRRRQRMNCEIQFPNAGHRRKVFGRTLQQLGVYEDIVKKRKEVVD